MMGKGLLSGEMLRSGGPFLWEKDMNEILALQLSADYCVSPEEIRDRKNHFAPWRPLEGRRRYREEDPCFLKIASVGGKLLFCGEASLLLWCRDRYEKEGGEWFFEAKNMRILNDRLHEDGYQIEMVHPFFISDTPLKVHTDGWEIRWFEEEEIETFRGDGRFTSAFTFDPGAPDVIGAAAVKDGRILGMAGASADSPFMWQIGINVEEEARGLGIGRMLTGLLGNEILEKGKLPFYGTAMSHIGSLKVAVGAGFVPAWSELVTSKIDS